MPPFSVTRNQLTLFTEYVTRPTRVFHITDTHLSLDDKRGADYRKHSDRMAKGYRNNRDFRTGKRQSAAQSFRRTLSEANRESVDFLALTGDTFSFPSEAAVEWATRELDAAGIPFGYVAGNHDWHYEGMSGSSRQLRETWAERRLAPLYQGRDPLCAAYEVNGITFVCVDNSIYEILPEQLDFFEAQLARATPLVLLIHIPLFMPGRGMGFGCAHPEWGAATDRNFEIERRERWPEAGHTDVTMAFRHAVFEAENLLAVLAGHTHVHTIDVENGIPQIVSQHNATGFYLDVRIEPPAG